MKFQSFDGKFLYSLIELEKRLHNVYAIAVKKLMNYRSAPTKAVVTFVEHIVNFYSVSSVFLFFFFIVNFAWFVSVQSKIENGFSVTLQNTKLYCKNNFNHSYFLLKK